MPATIGWDFETGKSGGDPKHHADVYVFCHFKHIKKDSANPMDLTQWDFYHAVKCDLPKR